MKSRKSFYNVAKAKERLSAVLREVIRGNEVIITDHNRPIAKLTPILGLPGPKKPLGAFLAVTPLKLRKKAIPSSRLIRELRDSEEH